MFSIPKMEIKNIINFQGKKKIILKLLLVLELVDSYNSKMNGCY